MHKAAVFYAFMQGIQSVGSTYVKKLGDLCYLNCKLKLTDHCIFELDSKNPRVEPSSTDNTLKLQEMLPNLGIGCTHCALSDLLSLTSKESQRTPLCCMCAQKISLSCAQGKRLVPCHCTISSDPYFTSYQRFLNHYRTVTASS